MLPWGLSIFMVDVFRINCEMSSLHAVQLRKWDHGLSIFLVLFITFFFLLLFCDFGNRNSLSVN